MPIEEYSGKLLTFSCFSQVKPRGFVTTGVDIVRKETALGLYKGLGAVLGGIIPKMAIRFTSYEWYKQLLADKQTGRVSSKSTFIGWLYFTFPSQRTTLY